MLRAMELLDCLPVELRAPGTTIAPIAAGLSGAGVFRVDAADEAYVLKVSSADEPVAAWRTKLQIRRLTADAGVTPRVVHADEQRRAIVTPFVTDRSFARLWFDPRTRADALALLGRTLRRVHDVPLPPGAPATDPHATLATLWSGALAGFAVPDFAGETARRTLAEEPPTSDRVPVLSHNDVNPTNLIYDGERLLLLDWEVAGANDPLYDLASIAVFLRMDDDTCRALMEAHDRAPVPALPERFTYLRRLVGVLCGTLFLHLARLSGHAGATAGDTLDATPSLIDVYQRMQTGALSVALADGKWAFGLALIKDAAGRHG